MSRWNEFGYYPPSRPREAKGGIKAQSKRGAFASSWGGRRWIATLESFPIGQVAIEEDQLEPLAETTPTLRDRADALDTNTFMLEEARNELPTRVVVIDDEHGLQEVRGRTRSPPSAPCPGRALAMCASMPAARQRSRNPSPACAVSAMIGVRARPALVSAARIRRVISRPSTFGISTSVTTRS